MPDTPRHLVAVIGGAVSGAEAVDALVEKGIHVVVFEQNDRPYGKIEDGLPRWHDKQRSQEYVKIDGKLDRPEVAFVPRTAVGTDVDFADLARDWGFSAVLLANGSWRDRPARVKGEDDFLEKGFYYQNPFIYWFNHHEEASYSGPAYEVADGAIVLGGGLASIDVAKVLMLETVAAKLRGRGLEVDVVEMEHAGIPKTLEAHGLRFEDLGLEGCTLVYRRSIGEMPVASARSDAPEEQERVKGVREKLLGLSTAKYLFQVREHSVAQELVGKNGRLAGVVLARTEYQGRKLVTLEESAEEVATPLVVSSIGSIPMPVAGIPMDGEFYRYTDWELGILEGYEGVYALGNVVTGKGNIAVSRKHGRFIADHVVANYLGVGDGAAKGGPAGVAEARRAEADAVANRVVERPALDAGTIAAIRNRVAARHATLGYTGYRAWIDAVSPR